jgi:hypothetical protein
MVSVTHFQADSKKIYRSPGYPIDKKYRKEYNNSEGGKK